MERQRGSIAPASAERFGSWESVLAADMWLDQLRAVPAHAESSTSAWRPRLTRSWFSLVRNWLSASLAAEAPAGRAVMGSSVSMARRTLTIATKTWLGRRDLDDAIDDA